MQFVINHCPVGSIAEYEKVTSRNIFGERMPVVDVYCGGGDTTISQLLYRSQPGAAGLRRAPRYTVPARPMRLGRRHFFYLSYNPACYLQNVTGNSKPNKHDKAQRHYWRVELVMEATAFVLIWYGIFTFLYADDQPAKLNGVYLVALSACVWAFSLHVACERMIRRVRNLENRDD